VYECTDLSGFFFKRDLCLRAGEREISVEVFAKNLVCTAVLKCLQDGDSVLIVDDLLSTGLSIDSMKAKIVEVSGAEGILFMGAAVLKV
jgi:adenine/guanine phosphoribosyltransferase-like PRPP-binding protein